MEKPSTQSKDFYIRGLGQMGSFALLLAHRLLNKGNTPIQIKGIISDGSSTTKENIRYLRQRNVLPEASDIPSHKFDNGEWKPDPNKINAILNFTPNPPHLSYLDKEGMVNVMHGRIKGLDEKHLKGNLVVPPFEEKEGFKPICIGPDCILSGLSPIVDVFQEVPHISVAHNIPRTDTGYYFSDRMGQKFTNFFQRLTGKEINFSLTGMPYVVNDYPSVVTFGSDKVNSRNSLKNFALPSRLKMSVKDKNTISSIEPRTAAEIDEYLKRNGVKASTIFYRAMNNKGGLNSMNNVIHSQTAAGLSWVDIIQMIFNPSLSAREAYESTNKAIKDLGL